MSFIADIKSVSEGAIGQLAGRFTTLPRPLLAAIGAGDMAVERLAELREQLLSGITPKLPGDINEAKEGAREFAAEVPAMVQRVAAGVLESVEQFAGQAPARTQKLVAELPEKLSEIRESLGQEQLRESVEAYTQLAGMLYGSLADRGDKAWSKVVAAAGVDPAVVDGQAAADTTASSEAEGAAEIPVDAADPVVKPARKSNPRKTTASAPGNTASENTASKNPASEDPTATGPANIDSDQV